MHSSRQLAAIEFTDVVGYTALMGSNEQKAFEILKKNRLIQKPIIEEFNGKFIKELGDAIGGTKRGRDKVADNGNGISQKILVKIFQPFFTTKPTARGIISL